MLRLLGRTQAALASTAVQGSWALFWLIDVVTVCVSTGESLHRPSLPAATLHRPASCCARGVPHPVWAPPTPAVLAFLVGALAPNQAVAGMALPMYTTSLLCELCEVEGSERWWVAEAKGRLLGADWPPSHPAAPHGHGCLRPPHAVQTFPGSSSPGETSREAGFGPAAALLAWRRPPPGLPPARCGASPSSGACPARSPVLALPCPHPPSTSCNVPRPCITLQPLLDLVLSHLLPALRLGRPHGQPGELAC